MGDVVLGSRPVQRLRTGRAEGRRLMTEGLLRYRPASGNIPAMALRIHQSVVRGRDRAC